MTHIKTLDSWSLPDIVSIPDGYDMEQVPEPTSRNMKIFMEKINELTDKINELVEINEKLKSL